MAKRFFRTLTQAELEAELKIIEKAILGTVASGSGGDSSATQKQRRELESSRGQILHDLNILDSTTYPRDDIATIKRTLPDHQ